MLCGNKSEVANKDLRPPYPVFGPRLPRSASNLRTLHSPLERTVKIQHNAGESHGDESHPD
jgi:hypothetical protein